MLKGIKRNNSRRNTMKRQLRIKYKDGSQLKVISTKSGDNSVFAPYLSQLSIEKVQEAGLYTYPLKDNEPLIFVERGAPKKV